MDRRVAWVLVYTGLFLTAIEFFFLPIRVQARIGGPGSIYRISLEAGVTWALASTGFYLVLPMFFQLFLHREPLAAVGYRMRGVGRHLGIYIGLYLVMAPFLWLASRRPAFQQIYPFVYDARSDWPSFLIWECSYLLQFFALEAFFRGYLLFNLEKSLGWSAVFVMMVPYCMIHYHKPWPEAFGALGAGFILGVLALRLRSFYGGFVLHALVALSMDLLGAHRGGLF